MSSSTHTFKTDSKILPQRTVRSDSATAARDHGGERKSWSLGFSVQVAAISTDLQPPLHHSTTPPLGVPGSFCGLTWQQEFLVMSMTRDDQVDPIPVEQRWQLHGLQIHLEVGDLQRSRPPNL